MTTYSAALPRPAVSVRLSSLGYSHSFVHASNGSRLVHAMQALQEKIKGLQQAGPPQAVPWANSMSRQPSQPPLRVSEEGGGGGSTLDILEQAWMPLAPNSLQTGWSFCGMR